MQEGLFFEEELYMHCVLDARENTAHKLWLKVNVMIKWNAN
jgi:hypothetical protein